MRAVPRSAACLAVLLAASGCSSAGYYAQSVAGHLGLMAKRRPIAEVVKDPATPDAVRRKLLAAGEIRDFASRELALPDGGSYRTFVDIGRPYVVWNVIAAPELSLEPREWCFPVAGCVAYRGYFDEARARDYAAELRRDEYDVHVSGARAYSTLGWFDDPLLSTVLDDPEFRLAAVIFHELAHERLYVAGDSRFNESFAVAVEREGVRRWLARYGSAEMRAAHAAARQRREAFLSLITKTRTELERAYGSDLSDERKRGEKARLLADLRRGYARLKSSWDGYAGYDRWFDGELNNAKLALLATYHDYVPAFERLLVVQQGDMAAFYAACEVLANLPGRQREARLKALAEEASPSSAVRRAQGNGPTISPSSSIGG